MTILVSVVIPTYGRAEALGKAIESVLGQTYKDLEVIIVDDNDPSSKDRSATRSIVEGYMAVDGRVRYVELERNVGGSLARNAGVEASVGELVTFLDDDDYYYPSKLEKQVSLLLSSGADVCLCNMHAIDGGRLAGYVKSSPVGLDLESFIVSGNVFTPMILVRRHIFNAVLGFTDTPRFQDHLLLMKILALSAKVVHLDECLFVHNVHRGERVSFSPKSRLAYKNKHFMEARLGEGLSAECKDFISFRQKKEMLACDIAEAPWYKVFFIFIREITLMRVFFKRKDLFVFFARQQLKKYDVFWFIRRVLFSRRINF